MKKILGLTLAVAAIVTTRAVEAQSPYFNAVTNLDPVLYFPLQETTPPPLGDVETNYGTLGAVANAVYSSANVTKFNPGATGDGDYSAFFSDANGSFLAVPTTDPLTAVTNSAFTVECWVDSAEQSRNNEGIICKAAGNGNGINHSQNLAGWCLSQNYIAYVDSANLRGFDFHVYNGIGHEGAEVVVPMFVTNNVWYHLVATFDGTNCNLYVNGVNMVASGYGYQLPMPAGTSYYPDNFDPIQIGASRNINGNLYHGGIDEVAIYPGVLSPSTVQTHYSTALTTSDYATAILGTTPAPLMYWRMDAPVYTAPDPSTYPIATDYGTFSTTSIQGLYGTAGQPGVSGPQFPGMLDPNNGNSSYALACNGIGGNNGATPNVPEGYDTNGNEVFTANAVPFVMQSSLADLQSLIFSPTNNNYHLTVAVWFKGNPDNNDRFVAILGQSDAGFRFAMNQSGGIQFCPGSGSDITSPYNYNDGNWHFAVGTYDGTNRNLYIDGHLDNSNTNSTTRGLLSYFPMLGAAPDYLSGGNNEIRVDGSTLASYNTRYFSGAVSQFALFTNVLTAAQVGNLYDTAVSNQAPYMISQPPAFRTAGAGGTNGVGGGSYIFFGAPAGGAQPLSFQWYYSATSNYDVSDPLPTDNVKYFGTTNLEVTVTNLMPSDSGYYFCIITNDYGSVTSILAGASFTLSPTITSQTPTGSFNLYSGQQAEMSVTASGPAPLTYQWYANDVADPNGTNSVYVSAPQTAAGSFYCVVANPYGSATSATVSVSSLLSLPAALTNSLFSSNILASGATAYWPMHEADEIPPSGPTETNYGTLGAIGNGYDGDWKNALLASLGINVSGGENADQNIAILHGVPGAIAGDSDSCMNFMGLTGTSAGFIDIPRGTNGDLMTLRPPFTLEAWVQPASDSGFGTILACDGGTADGLGNRAGFEWIYSGTTDAFSMPMYDGNGGESSEPKTSANYPPGQWYYLVTTFDGTNIAYYINGVQEQNYIQLFSHTNPVTGQVYRPNTWDQISIGCSRGLGNNGWKGKLDEIAVYTNILAYSDITNHYFAGTNGAGNYASTVLGTTTGAPWLYYRMDSPVWTPPPLSTWPVLTNYGSIAFNGVYAPNSVPANGPGPSEAGVPVGGLFANNAMLMDGWNTFADAGNMPLFHPKGKTPFTVAAWVKGNPSDLGRNGWHSIVGEGDGSWRLNMNGGNGRANFNSQNSGDIGNNTTSGISANINDGNWHYVVGTCDGTNTIVYVDGQVSATNINTKLNNNDANVSTLLGGYPANTTTWETNAAAVVGNEAGRVVAGSMCDAAFWYGTALTKTQIASLYTSLNIAPLIERQPTSRSVNQDSAFTNDILIASGSGPLAYQWYQDGVARAGQTNSFLNLPNVQTSDASSNWLAVVTNNWGSATSAVFSVTVFSAPQVTQNLYNTNFSVYAGAQVPFSISAVGEVPLFYQWYSNSVAIAGATNTSIVITAEPANATNTYYCIVSNSVSTVSSSIASVTIMPLPSAPYVGTIMSDRPVGFWRLNEPGSSGSAVSGIVANDYIGGNNGIYTNASLQNPPYNTLDTNAASAGFGPLPIAGSVFANSDVYGIPNVDFSSTNGHTSSFTVEAWVKGVPQSEVVLTTDAGLVGKGYAGGGEQFYLDCGSDTTNAANPLPHSYRFFVRDFATGGSHNVTSTVNPSDASWHHLVGVCDGVNGRLLLYIDGLLAGTNSINPTNGILPSASTMVIGSRAQSAATSTSNNWQFAGYVEDVAVYNYALSSNQIANHFDASEFPATIYQTPQSATASAGGSATFTVGAVGTPIPGYATGLAYQWYANAAAITGATNTTLVLNNIPAGDNGYQYTVTVTNLFGSASSTPPAILTVISGAPVISNDLASVYFVAAGGTISLPVTIYGTEPISYQWQFNGVNLSDNDRITGSQSNVLTIAEAQSSDAGNYQLLAQNGSGQTNSVLAQLIVGTVPVSFGTNTYGWSSNSIAGAGTNEIVLTDHDLGKGNGSYWFQYPQYIGAFQASFTYHAYSQSASPADGIAFCLQNDPRGAAALGGAGGSLGVSGIVPSWELEYNIYPNAGPGYAINVNGVNGGNSTNGFWSTQPFDNNDPGTGASGPGGDPVSVTIYYADDQMTLTWTDAVAQASYTTTWSGDLPSIVGSDTAYIGFTGAYGASYAKQVISNFQFVSIPQATIQFSAPNALITWPTITPGYTLQENSDLRTTNWVNVPGTVIVTNGMYQATVPVTSGQEFYRLVVP